jgi:hypothetical protein
MSKRVERRIDTSKLPGARWLGDNWGWITLLVLSFAAFLWTTWRALFRSRSRGTSDNPKPSVA